jgi:hypothetical protein
LSRLPGALMRQEEILAQGADEVGMKVKLLGYGNVWY